MALDARELEKRVQKLRKSLKRFSRNPAVDEVHDLRTRTRRVESILHALDMDKAKNEEQILSALKSIRKRAGKVRDMDVLTGYIVGLKVDDDPHCVVRLVHHLGYERHRHAGKLHSLVRQNAPELRRRLRSSQKKLGSTLEQSAKASANLERKGAKADDAPLHAMSVALRLSRELGAVPRLGSNNLHPYRIQVKRLRYILQMADSDDGQQKEFIEALKQVQDSIGEWHDWLELSGIANEVLRHQSGCTLLQKIDRRTHEKLSEALRVTEQMRRRYLASGATHGRRKSKAKARPAPISGPVLLATSEMAAD